MGQARSSLERRGGTLGRETLGSEPRTEPGFHCSLGIESTRPTLPAERFRITAGLTALGADAARFGVLALGAGVAIRLLPRLE